jgi:hypothetical protein
LKISFKDVKSNKANQASLWLTFADGSGEIRIHQEKSLVYVEDLGIRAKLVLAILAFMTSAIPVVGLVVIVGVLGTQGTDLAMKATRSWQNTQLYILDYQANTCVLAMEFHYHNNCDIDNVLADISNEIIGEDTETEDEYEIVSLMFHSWGITETPVKILNRNLYDIILTG